MREARDRLSAGGGNCERRACENGPPHYPGAGARLKTSDLQQFLAKKGTEST